MEIYLYRVPPIAQNILFFYIFASNLLFVKWVDEIFDFLEIENSNMWRFKVAKHTIRKELPTKHSILKIKAIDLLECQMLEQGNEEEATHHSERNIPYFVTVIDVQRPVDPILVAKDSFQVKNDS